MKLESGILQPCNILRYERKLKAKNRKRKLIYMRLKQEAKPKMLKSTLKRKAKSCSVWPYKYNDWIRKCP